ncbi:Glyco-tran-10-N domain-containing protein [Aphelenchoides besseyi]|nr:Glyco-tran-10-N domain-containing protein [Aphelenchoides besseyi]KAI6193550.1 Glyco-tran-10-N domain-containing protein [Aphelenchoides besseyi]
MRPTTSQRPVSRGRKRLDDLKTKETEDGGQVEELNIRVQGRNTNTAPKGILDTLRLFRRTKPQPPAQPQVQQTISANSTVIGHNFQGSAEFDVDAEDTIGRDFNNLNVSALDDNASVLNLNPNNYAGSMGLDTIDFSSVDFGKFEDIVVEMIRINFSRFAIVALLLVLSGLLLLTTFGPKTTNTPLFYDIYRVASTDSSVKVSDSETRNSSEPPTVLFWTRVFNGKPQFDYCPLETACRFTTDRSTFESANAVVFHGHDIKLNDLPGGPANARQKFVFYSQESFPSLDAESQRKWWRSNLQFHWVMAYMSKAHVRVPYGGFYVDPETAKARQFNPIADFNQSTVTSDKSTRGALWFVSNCKSEERLRVAKELSNYYFYLAFENSNCEDYITEKFDNLLQLPVVPIVMKRSVYAKILPSNAFVAVDDFDSAKDLADHLKFLMDHPYEYFKLIEWRNEWAKAKWNAESYRIGTCGLCERLQKEIDVKSRPIDDLKSWYRSNSPCSPSVQHSWFN